MDINSYLLLLVTSGCLAVDYSAWSAIAALHLSVIVFSLDLELRLLHSFGTIGESSIEHISSVTHNFKTHEKE